MKKIKITALLIAAALLLVFTACDGMNYQTDSVSIDLSKAVSRAPGADTVRIWLVAEGSSSFFDLGDESEQDLTPNADGSYTVTLSKIPVGPTYKIYLSIGTITTVNDKKVFTVNETANGQVSVTGGSNTGVSISGSAPDAVAYTDLAGKALKGVVKVDGNLYTTDGTKLYYGEDSFTEDTPTTGYTFNSITKGIYGAADNWVPYLSADADNGRALFPWSGSFVTSFADGLAASDAITPPIDILSTDIFTSGTVQIGISQIDAGLIISFYDTETVEGDPVEWIPVDLGAFLEEAGVSLTGKLIRGLTVIVDDDAKTGMIYMATKAGNFRKEISWATDAVDPDEDLGDVFPVETSPLYAERILNIDSPAGNVLYLGTSNGLWKADVTAEASAIKNEKLLAAAGKRIEILKSGANYTACVTALELIIVENNKAAPLIRTVSFNEGLPVSGKLTGDTGVTGLEWDGDTLYVSGNYGLAKINAAELF